jgi:hypothetical protein
MAVERDGEALAISRDNRRAFAADPARHAVLILPLDGGPDSTVECGCAPVDLDPLAGNAVFRVTGAAGRRIWLLDADAAEPRFVFVPAAGEGGAR